MNQAIRKALTSKVFLIPLAALILYTLTGFILAPVMVRWYVPKYAQENLQCQAGLDVVRINPFLLTVEATGFSLNQTDGSPIAALERLFVDFDMKSLFHWAAIFREITFDKPTLNLVVEADGGLNLQKLIPKSQETQKPKGPDSKPLGMFLQNIAIHGGKLSITDRRQSRPAHLSFEAFDLHLKDLSTLQDHNGTCFLTASTPEGETIHWEGEVTLAPLRSNGKLSLNGIRTATLWEFAQDSLNLEPPKGQLNVTTAYRLDGSATPVHLGLEGLQVGLSDFSLKLVDADKAFLELRKVQLDVPNVDLTARTLQVEKLLAEGGTVDIRIDQSGRINLQQIMRETPRKEKKEEQTSSPEAPPGSNQEGAPPTAAGSPFKVRADAIEIKNIGLALADSSRTTPIRAGFSSMDLTFKANIEAGAQETKVSLKGIASELKEVQLGTSQSPEPLFRTERLTVSGGECDLGARSLAVSRIGLTNGHLDVARDREGQINWTALFATKGAPEGASAPKSASRSGQPWKFLVKSFEVDGFSSKLSDLTALADKPLFNLHAFNAKLTEVDGNSPMGFDVGFQVEQGGSATLRGKVNPSAPSVEAEVNVSGLVLTPLQPYLEPLLTLVLRSAAFSTQGKLRYGLPDAGANLVYEGSVNLGELSLSEPDSKETYLGLDAMQIPRLKLTLQPNGFEAGEITLSKPVGELIIAEDRTVNLVKVFKSEGAKDKPSTPPAAGPKEARDAFPFRIGKVRVENGNTVFADLSLRPKFMTRIHDLKGTIAGLSSAKDTMAKIQLDGRVDQYGLAKINGVLSLYDPKHSADIDMVFRNVEMTKLSPYSGKFAGRHIKSGKLSMDLKYRIKNNQLSGDNKIILDNLVLGERVNSPDAVNLPLDLAVALLQDSNGRIDIGLPVSGDLNNPQFSIGPLIWKGIVNLLTKAVTAPFRALGSLFGGEAKTFDAVVFDPGKAELLPPEKEKLKKLADVLKKRPQLKLAVQGRYSPEADGMELKELSVRRAVATRLGAKLGLAEDPGPLDLTDSKSRRSLEEMFKERFGKSALDELEQGIKKGTIKPRTPEAQETEKGKQKKSGRFSRMMNSLKVYKVIPGGKSPEESTALAGELYIRLVESDPVAEETMQKLAGNRAQAISKELESSAGIPSDRLTIRDPEPLAGDEGASVKLSLDAMPVPQ